MKKSLLYVTVFLSFNFIWSQAPNKMSYQAVVRDADNNLVTEQAIGLQVSILSGTPDGTSVYGETHTSNSNINGLISIVIGEGNPTTGNFSDIDWASNTYYIKTEIDPEGGANYTLVGIQQLLSVPYAMHAKTADNLGGIQGNELGEMLYWDGTSWVTIPAGGDGQVLSFCNGKPTWSFCIETILGGEPTGTTMRVEGRLTASAGWSGTTRGICYSTTPNPTIADFTQETVGWTAILNNLTFNTTYYAKAYLITNGVVQYAANQVSFTTSGTYEIGDYYPDEGGVLFYILQPGDEGYDANTRHGLIVSLTNIGSTDPKWGCFGTSIPGTLETIGSGHDNTTLIINNCNENSVAAKSCSDYTSMGFEDWYLGSSQEMLQLANNREIVNDGLTSIENSQAVNFQFLTSTESSEFQALRVIDAGNFSYTFGTNKNSSQAPTRPIRSF